MQGLMKTSLKGLPLVYRGKVRECYALDDDKLLMIATDRISAFDVILSVPIANKGKVLTGLTQFWFEKLASGMPTQLTDIAPESVVAPDEVDQVAGRAMVVKRLKPILVECVARGYVIGSSWKSYQEDGTICGIKLPAGLQKAEKLPEPIFTPAAKAEVGTHDENIDFDRVCALYGKDIAAIIVEPIAGNMGLVLPEEGFLKALRALCDTHGALLIMDEVITGFRAEYGGAQTRFGITPDLTTLGKIIGGGLPVGAFGGKREYMSRVAPAGDVYQAGTLSGNPLAMAAGIATLSVLKASDYAALEARVEAFAAELESILRGKGVPVTVNRLASMYTVFFSDGPLRNFEDVKNSDTEMYSRFFRAMRERNIFVAPSAFEVAMVSFAHTEEDFAKTLDAVRGIKL